MSTAVSIADAARAEAVNITSVPVAEASARRSVTADVLGAIERAVSTVPILSGLAIVAGLWLAQAVLIPVVLSILLSYALEPVIARLEHWHVKRAVAVPFVLTALISTAAGGAYALRGEAVAFVNRLPGAMHTLAQAVQTASQQNPGAIGKVQQAAHELETAASSATKTDQGNGVTAVRIEQPAFNWSGWVWQGGVGVLEFAGQMFAVLCLVYYLLAAGDLYKRKLVRIVPTLTDKKVTVQILAEIDRQIERFLLARIVISAIVGVLIWLVFRLFGLAEPGVWGVLAAVLFAIPIAGPTIVVVGAALAGFVQFGSLAMGGVLGGACVVIGALEGNVLTPWLMSRVGAMNAVAVFVSLLFWGWIWGAWGLLLAVPITATLKAVCERIDDFNAYAELLKK
jgi:predicted PurR-regulated permease PerM